MITSTTSPAIKDQDLSGVLAVTGKNILNIIKVHIFRNRFMIIDLWKLAGS
jgi:hypothetical protein